MSHCSARRRPTGLALLAMKDASGPYLTVEADPSLDKQFGKTALAGKFRRCLDDTHRFEPPSRRLRKGRLVTITRFSFPTDIHFGAGARKLVAAHLLRPAASAR